MLAIAEDSASNASPTAAAGVVAAVLLLAAWPFSLMNALFKPARSDEAGSCVAAPAVAAPAAAAAADDAVEDAATSLAAGPGARDA